MAVHWLVKNNGSAIMVSEGRTDGMVYKLEVYLSSKADSMVCTYSSKFQSVCTYMAGRRVLTFMLHQVCTI